MTELCELKRAIGRLISLTKQSRAAATGSPRVWTNRARKRDEAWEHARHLAKKVFLLGDPYAPPPPPPFSNLGKDI